MKLSVLVSLAWVSSCLACSSGDNESGGTPEQSSSVPDCAYGKSGGPASLQSEVGNDCSFDVSVNGDSVVSGTCTSGGVVRDVTRSGSPPSGGGDMELSRDTLMDTSDPDQESFDLVVNFGKTAWPDAVGFSWELASGSAPSVDGFHSSVHYTRMTKGNSAGTARLSDPEFVSFGCAIVGATKDEKTQAFSVQIDSAEPICSFQGEPQYLVHGSLTATCVGNDGPEQGADGNIVAQVPAVVAVTF